jgi:DNA-binding XRE family transcriptional regulator
VDALRRWGGLPERPQRPRPDLPPLRLQFLGLDREGRARFQHLGTISTQWTLSAEDFEQFDAAGWAAPGDPGVEAARRAVGRVAERVRLRAPVRPAPTPPPPRPVPQQRESKDPASDAMASWAEEVRSLRQRAALSMRAAAKAIGISKGSFEVWESGAVVARSQMQERVRKALRDRIGAQAAPGSVTPMRSRRQQRLDGHEKVLAGKNGRQPVARIECDYDKLLAEMRRLRAGLEAQVAAIHEKIKALDDVLPVIERMKPRREEP